VSAEIFQPMNAEGETSFNRIMVVLKGSIVEMMFVSHRQPPLSILGNADAIKIYVGIEGFYVSSNVPMNRVLLKQNLIRLIKFQ
jgi:hypothetical protein